MIYFCDFCRKFKKEEDFQEYYTYEENMCDTCKERDPEDDGIDEDDFEQIAKRKISEMMFGEDDADFLPDDDLLDEDDDFIDDGDIEEDE